MLAEEEDQRLVVPNGLTVRRLRHERHWSPRDLVSAIAQAQFIATGLRETITPTLLQRIEEKSQHIPYQTLLLLARGLDCDPVDILGE